MNAGRELDAMIAEKVMGYRLKRDDCNSFWVNPEGDEPAHGHDYSTSIAAAWEVVEKFNYLYLWRDPSTTFKGWECKLVFDDEDRFYARQADTAPHAICLAALKAIS